jgi:chaperonin cofactor prefoldin
MSLIELINSYNKALNSNEDAVKTLTNLTSTLNEMKKKSFEDELKDKIRLLNLRTRIINGQIKKRLEEIKMDNKDRYENRV